MAAYDRVDDSPDKRPDRKLLSRLMSYVHPYRKWVVISVICSILSSFLLVSRADMTRIAFDSYIIPGDLNGLYVLCGGYALLLFSQAFLQFGLAYAMAYIGQNIIFDLRVKLFRHTVKLDSVEYDRRPVGEMVSRVTNDVNALSEMFSSGLIMVVTDVLVLTFITVRMFIANWQLAAISFIVLPFLLIVSFAFRIKARAAFRIVRRQVGRLNGFMQERISGMGIVHAFRRERADFEEFTKVNKELRGAHKRTIFYYALFFPVVELLSTLTIALIIWYGGGQVVQERLKLGELIMFIHLIEMFFRPVFDLSDKYNLLQNALASSERIFKLLDTEPTIVSPPSAKTPDGCVGKIDFDDVTFSYVPGEVVLKQFSLSVDPGETLAVVGATGAGKTTIISLLSRFYEPQKGTISLDGNDIRTLDLKWLREHVSMVLQDVFLFPGSIAENVSLGNPSITREAIVGAIDTVGAGDFVNALPDGIDTVLSEGGGSLSVGQRQLISFARALAFNPGILVLDEATSSVDTETEHTIQKAIDVLLEGRTSIVIAHRLSTIRHADRIAVMHHGELRELGTHEELITEGGIYNRLYQLQYKDQETDV